MKKQLKKLIVTLLASAAAVSAFSTGASAAEVQEESIPESFYVITESTAASDENVRVPGSVQEPSADSSKVGVIPSKMYKYKITDVKDYIEAVKSTMSDSKDVESAKKAVNNYVPVVDNMKSKYFPVIGTQVGGTCCAWANVYYQLTYEVNKKLDRAASVSTNMQPVFVYNLARYIEGGIMPDICMEMIAHAGCATFKNAPDKSDLNDWHADYETWVEANQYRISSYMYYSNVGNQDARITSVNDPDIEAIKATLRNGDLICFTSLVGWRSGYIGETPDVPKEMVGKSVVIENQTSSGAHEMTIVGYNDNIWVDINGNGKIDNGESGAFRVVDNYGTSQYNDGCYWFAYDSLNTQSVVDGVVYNEKRVTSMYDFIKLNLDKAWKPSDIFLKYTVSTSNRADNYVEITAGRKSDGMKYISKTAPYCTVENPYTKSALNGKSGADDGTMIFDLDNIIPDLNSDNFHDYNWSIRFVDKGNDSSAFVVKEAVIVDNNNGKTYALDAAVPFSVNKSEKTAKTKNYYHFAKLYTPDASEMVVGKQLKFTFKTANETFGSTPIKYTMTVSSNGKQVFSKVHRATATYKDKNYSVVKGTWVASKPGVYKVTISAKDAAGKTASRSAEIKVYNNIFAVRSINIDKGTTLCQYDKIRITPLVVGGKAPYTYSYYYIKGDKTYKIAENTKSSYKTKQLGGGTGNYKLLVKVKDADGKTVQATQSYVVAKAKVKKFIYNRDNMQKNTKLYIRCETRNLPEGVKDTSFEYTAEKDGKVEILQYSDPYWPNQVVWTPTADGTYKLTVKIKYNDKVIAQKSEEFLVGAPQLEDIEGMRKIKVCVVTHVANVNSSANFKLRYWGGKAGAQDANCIDTGTTATKNVGFWSTAQTFKVYTAYIPLDATGFKFHIGNRWFPESGGDGSVSTSNTLYAFNYDYDRVLYTKE